MGLQQQHAGQGEGKNGDNEQCMTLHPPAPWHEVHGDVLIAGERTSSNCDAKNEEAIRLGVAALLNLVAGTNLKIPGRSAMAKSCVAPFIC